MVRHLNGIIFVTLIFIDSHAFGTNEDFLLMTEIAPGTCSFSGERLCEGIPGPVIQQHLQQGPCAESLAQLCGNIEPGERRLVNCLRQKGHLIDSKCANWGKKVGLDFMGSGNNLPDLPTPTVTEKKTCFGSAWFTNPGCRTVNHISDLENTPKTPSQMEEVSSIPSLEALLSPTY